MVHKTKYKWWQMPPKQGEAWRKELLLSNVHNNRAKKRANRIKRKYTIVVAKKGKLVYRE